MRVALFISCLADRLFPQVGKATVALLHRLGIRLSVPAGQTCCGQPAFTAGYRDDATAVARHTCAGLTDALADGAEAIVVPSGSCAQMIRRHYPDLLGDHATDVAGHVLELSQLLTDRLGLAAVPSSGPARPMRLAYHDSCHLLRGVGVEEGPRRLLAAAANVELVDLDPRQECCGFGGTFSLKMEPISADMASGKADRAESLQADAVVAGDLGCLMNMGGVLRRRRSGTGVMHYAQVLAGPAHCTLL